MVSTLAEKSFVQHEACPECGSKDNLGRYSDGQGYCFGCGYYESPGGDRADVRGKGAVPLLWGEPSPIPRRALDVETCQKFRYLLGKDDDGNNVQLATYYDAQGRPVAQKVRYVNKDFMWVGEPKRALLFGQQLWSAGGRRVVVTEGEIDALSVSQALGNRWPVVSIPNGAQGARRDLAKQIEWLDSFREVVILFDEDEPGHKAAAECAELLTPGKARIARLPLKDPSEMLVAGRTAELVRAVWEAAPYRPDGVVAGAELWSTVNSTPEIGLTYPWSCLDSLLYGQRRREIVTWTAGTGIGKSSFVREIAYSLAQEHQQNVGIIALEESVRHAAVAQLAIAMNKRLHLPDVWKSVPEEERAEAFAKVFGSGRYFFYDHFGSISADSMIPKVRYLVLALGCKWIILDHLSIMVSGMATEGDERKRIDELMTRLRSLVEELDFGLHIVSHLRKASGTPFEEGGTISLVDLRGSGAIAQVSNIVIGVERNQQDNDEKHISTLRVLKNRFSGETGVAGTLKWDAETGRLHQVEFDVAAAAEGKDEEGDF